MRQREAGRCRRDEGRLVILGSLVQVEPTAGGADRRGRLAGCMTLRGRVGWDLQFHIPSLTIAFLSPGIQGG